jgi:outer membrane protein assembly factor BamB
VGAAVAVSTLLASSVARADSLFIADVGDNSVRQFDSSTGAFIGTFVPSEAQGLNGPMGLIFTNGQLLLVNQNFGNAAGEVFRFDGQDGTFINKLVPARIVWTRFCNSGGLFQGGCLTGFMG